MLTNRKNKVAAAQQKRANATDEFEQLSLDNEIKDLEDEASEAEEAFDGISVEEAKDELEYESSLRTKFWKAIFPSGGRSLNVEDCEGLADYDEASRVSVNLPGILRLRRTTKFPRFWPNWTQNRPTGTKSSQSDFTQAWQHCFLKQSDGPLCERQKVDALYCY